MAQNQAWTMGLFRKVQQIARAGGPKHQKRLAAVLRSLAARVDEKASGRTTALLEKYPDMPVRFFAPCLGVSYHTGQALYKQWHEKRKKELPHGGRTGEAARARWAEIVAQEIGLK